MARLTIREIGQELSEEELRELNEADNREVVFDEDSPEMTPEMLLQFKKQNKASRAKQTASIRLSEKAQKFSKAYGKGYTSFLSRLIDAALDDEKLVKRCI